MNAIAEDLWPSDIVDDIPITPVNILKAQAAKIGEKTKNLVEGRVDTSSSGDRMVHSFKLVAPALSNYSYELFRLVHPIDLYPIDVLGALEPTIRSEAELVVWLKGKLSRPATLQIVRSLIAQSS